MDAFAGSTEYRPVVGLGFYNAPYLYANGSYFQPTPIVTYNANPGYGNTVIETSGPGGSGFRPRFMRNASGYIDPVQGNTYPRQWTTYVYYTNTQINQYNSDTCPGGTGSGYTGFRTIGQRASALVKLQLLSKDSGFG